MFVQLYRFEVGRPFALLSVEFSVDSENADPAQTEVVLQGGYEISDLSFADEARELRTQLRALGDSRCSQRVSLAREFVGGVDDHSSAVSVVSSVDEFTRFAFLTQPGAS